MGEKWAEYNNNKIYCKQRTQTMGENFANQIYDKGIIFRVYKELLKSITAPNNPILKLGIGRYTNVQ